MTSLGIGLGSKRLELLRDLIPTATDFALLVNPINPAVADAAARELQAAVAKLSLHLHVLRASTEHEIDVAFAEVSRLHASGVVVAPDAFFDSRSEQPATLSIRYAVPAIYQFREFVLAGGPMR